MHVARLLVAVCVLALLHLVYGFCSIADEPPEALHRYTLDNGLRVWHLQRVENESVVVAVSVRVGSRNETEENNGISHLLEHMVFAETERIPEGEVTNFITKLGGVYNAATQHEKTIFYAVLASQEFSTAAEWISQVVFHATLPEDRVDRERTVVFQEKGGETAWFARQLEKRGFGYDVERTLREALFPQSALTLPIIGEDRSLRSIDRSALASYYQRHYVPNNAVLIVVGNVTDEQVRSACEEYFANVPAGQLSLPEETPSPPVELPQDPVKVRAPTFRSQCTIMTGARGVNMRHPDWWPLEVLATYLQFSVEKKARLEKGLAYGIFVSNDTHSDSGLISLHTSCDRKNRRELQAVIEGELDALRRGEIDAERFAEARTLLIGRRALAMESNMSHAVWLESLAYFYENGETLPDYESSVKCVSEEDVARAARTHLAPERVASVVHLPLF
jgi:predicted Zn-dependent peptidase